MFQTNCSRISICESKRPISILRVSCDQDSRERVSIANGPPIFTATVHATSGCQAMQRIYLGIVFLSVTGLVFLALVSLDRLIGQ